MPAFDVAVIGLGAMGSAAAWHLARRGLRVVGIDRHTPPHHFGSTHGYTRIIREAYYEHPLYVPLVQRASVLWDELSAAAGTKLLRRTGGLMIGPEQGTLVSGALRSARLHQLPCALWSAAEVRERVPALDPDEDMVGLWEPRAGLLLPEKAVDAMLRAARGHGARLVFDTTVTGWSAGSAGVTVATQAQDYHAARLVVAAGAWTSQLLPRVAIPLTVERAVQFWFAPAGVDGVCGPDRLPVFVMQHAVGRLLYGLPDLGHGVKIASHHGGEITTADSVRRSIDRDERNAMRTLAMQWVPGVSGAIREASVCLYTNTPDGHFVIDRHPEHPEVVIASACSGHGFKFATVIGELLADIVTERTPAFDLSPFALARFPVGGGPELSAQPA